VPAQSTTSVTSSGPVKGLAWPTLEDTCDALHVRIVTGIDDKTRKLQVGSDVFVNETLRRALGKGPVPLSPPILTLPSDTYLSKETAPPPPHFTILGELRLSCPSYMHLLPPVARDELQRLWVTNFGMARPGSVVGIDLTGTREARRVGADFAWPNAVEHVPEGAVPSVKGGAILVADGFLVPGKNDGGVFLVADPGGKRERVARISPQKAGGWFYHRAVTLNINGHRGVLTARACKPMNPFQEALGELVWLELPDTPSPLSDFNLPWRETVLAQGPDVMFEVVDLNPDDGTVEVLAAEFFSQRLTLHALEWDERERCPRVVHREVIDDKLGYAYSVVVADLDGPRSHLLVTTHEYLPAEKRSSPLGWVTGQKTWSYANMPTPKDARALAEDETVAGGSLFAYRIPSSLLGEKEGAAKAPGEGRRTGNRVRLRAIFDMIDRDGSGGLSISELEQALTSLEVEATHDEIQAMFAQADWDGSGSIDFEEFTKVCDSLQTRNWDRILRDRGVPAPDLGSRLFGQAIRGLASARTAVDESLESLDPVVQFRRAARSVFREQASGRAVLQTPEVLRALRELGAQDTDVELTAMCVEADVDADGALDMAEFETVALGTYKDVVAVSSVWARALSGLVQTAVGLMPGREINVWERTTLASGFRVKRIGINPGAPGFVYPFHPHRSMKGQGGPPHLLLAGDCADAAYVFKPRLGVGKCREGAPGSKAALGGAASDVGAVQGGGVAGGIRTKDGRCLHYELMATFGCEGTVGSIAVGEADTLQAEDDG